MVVEGVLKFTQVSMQNSEYEWIINNFERLTPGSTVRTSPAFCSIPKVSAQFHFLLKSKKSCRHIGGSYFMVRFRGNLSLCSVGSAPEFLKVTIETSLLNEQGLLVDQGKKIEQSLNCNDIRCLTFKKIDLMVTQANEYLLKLQNNVLVVKCHLNILNNEFLKRITENLSGDCSSYLKDLSNDLKKIYSSTALSDVTIRVGQKEFKVHRAVLAARSPVFSMMLEHDCIESKTNIINLPGYDLYRFELFLKYLYTGVFEDNDMDCVLAIYKLADMYDVQSLQRTCVDIIEEKFVLKNQAIESMGDLCKILKLAYELSSDKLKTLVTKTIVNHFLLIGQQSQWKDFVISDPQIASEVLVSVASTYKDILSKHLK